MVVTIEITSLAHSENLEKYIDGLDKAYDQFKEQTDRETESLAGEHQHLKDEAGQLLESFANEIEEIKAMAQEVTEGKTELGEKGQLLLSEKRASMQEGMNTFLEKVGQVHEMENSKGHAFHGNEPMMKAIEECKGAITALATEFMKAENQVQSNSPQIEKESGVSR